MPETVHESVSDFQRTLRAKLSNAGAQGQPEDQLRSPFERLLKDIGAIGQINGIECVGESAQADLGIRPDFAVTVKNILIGHVELKAPGKGADPRLFTDKHDREQWKKLSLCRICCIPTALNSAIGRTANKKARRSLLTRFEHRRRFNTARLRTAVP